MARVKPGLFSAVSGRVGGVEFAMAREGMVVKRKKPPRPFDSPAQIAAATTFYRRVADWQAMTQEAMLEWTAYANTHPVKNRLGKVIYLTGYNWFMKGRGTDDGILLPFGKAAPPVFGPPLVYDGGPYSFPITWQAESTDDWSIWIEFYDLTAHPPSPWGVPPSRIAGWYDKPDIGNLDFAHLAAKGITFTTGRQYEIRGFVKGPRWFQSGFGLAVFRVTAAVQWVWHLTMDDDAANTTVVDAFGHYDQVFEGATPNTEDHAVAGVHDGALHFDGAGDHIALSEESYQADLDVDQPFTLAIWWKPDAPIGATWDDFLSSYAVITPCIRFAINNVQTIISVTFLLGGARYYATYVQPNADVSIWQHFAIVRNGTNFRIFRNGEKNYDVTAAGFNGAVFKDGTPLTIGAQRGITNFAKGAADDVYLFNYALSDAEVAALAVP